MTRVDPIGRRGVALLIVLATMTLAIAGATMLARVALVDRLAQDFREDARIARMVHEGATPLAEHWLRHASPTAVRPSDAATAEFRVAEERLSVSGRPVTITLTAYDQLGMLPWPLHTDVALLRTATGRRDIEPVRHAFPGLDVLESANATTRIVPRPGEAVPAFAALIATHNPLPPLSPGARYRAGRGAINVNTAPMPLVEAVMRRAGRGGVELIRAARAAGEPAPIAQLPAGPADDTSSRVPALVGQSNTWAVRTDIRVGRNRFVWWDVYLAMGDRWECVQRHVSPE